MRKLQEYYQFGIQIKKGQYVDGREAWYCNFLKTNGEQMPDSYIGRLTPSQWNKAKEIFNKKVSSIFWISL
jgi:hypothetical protein